MGRWEDSQRREEFLAVKRLKCQNPSASLQDLLLVLAPRMQEGGGQGPKPSLRTSNVPWTSDASPGLGPTGAGGLQESCPLPVLLLGTMCRCTKRCTVQWDHGMGWEKLGRTLGNAFPKLLVWQKRISPALQITTIRKHLCGETHFYKILSSFFVLYE